MAGNVEFWLSYDSGAERLRLPVNPESISVSSPFGMTDVAVSQLGEVSIFGTRGLAELSFSSFFPNHYNPSFCEYRNFKEPWLNVETIERWRDSKRPIRLIVTGTRINYAATIREFALDVERAGNIGDIYFSMNLKEYRFIDLRVQRVTTGAGSTGSKKTKPSRPATPKAAAKGAKSHTVVRNDTLQKIAKKYYGSVNDWRKIYNANKAAIGGNPNVIKAGQKLVIP
ncbi:LysM peptidoglycan-binding domain-containing protein [uncultured Planococcus sp.]|uniref:LysM peptidoglycan-binding domain-containing protein n=1 Tax=uncultured Planococcus sp. TaxID=337815 RepID=UPI0026149699|nr:LysM peptidoglycan-binding domain-containing protein [uncultured Planococcus sp.]